MFNDWQVDFTEAGLRDASVYVCCTAANVNVVDSSANAQKNFLMLDMALKSVGCRYDKVIFGAVKPNVNGSDACIDLIGVLRSRTARRSVSSPRAQWLGNFARSDTCRNHRHHAHDGCTGGECAQRPFGGDCAVGDCQSPRLHSLRPSLGTSLPSRRPVMRMT